MTSGSCRGWRPTAAALPGIFLAELGCLAGTAVQNLQVWFVPADPVTGAQSVQSFRQSTAGAELRVELGNLSAGHAVEVLVRLDLAANMPLGTVPLGQVWLEYDEVQETRQQRQELHRVSVLVATEAEMPANPTFVRARAKWRLVQAGHEASELLRRRPGRKKLRSDPSQISGVRTASPPLIWPSSDI